MNTDTRDLFRQVLGLDEKDRVILASLLLESLEEGRDSDAEALWRAEVSKRLEELASGGIKAISWEEVQSRLLHRLWRCPK
jgi:putative addiction module component (TIGR02574 family)